MSCKAILSNVHIFILTVNPNQQVPMQSGQGGQSSSKSDFGLEDLNFDPDTLIGADGTGEQTDFGNVRYILNTFQALGLGPLFVQRNVHLWIGESI